MLSEDEIQEIRDEAERTVVEAVDFADNSPSRHSTRSTTISTSSATRCPAGTAWTSGRLTPTPLRRSGRARACRLLAERGANAEDEELREAEGDQPTRRRRTCTDGRDADAGGAPDAMAEEMRRDENVLVMGEDVAVFQGSFKVTEGLLDEFGEAGP